MSCKLTTWFGGYGQFETGKFSVQICWISADNSHMRQALLLVALVGLMFGCSSTKSGSANRLKPQLWYALDVKECPIHGRTLKKAPWGWILEDGGCAIGTVMICKKCQKSLENEVKTTAGN
jgi:hypothetical protein